VDSDAEPRVSEESSSDLPSYDTMYRVLSFFHALDVPDFARLMSEFAEASKALERGNTKAMSRMLAAIAVDARLAAGDPDAIRLAKKQIEEQLQDHGPIGDGRKYITERRRGAA
jgi:hypothetical protein